MADALKELLSEFISGQEAVRRATVRCEHEGHPSIPGLTKWRFTGQMREAVQGAIDARTREVDEHPHGGFAQFSTPARNRDGAYESRGEVMLYPAEAVA